MSERKIWVYEHLTSLSPLIARENYARSLESMVTVLPVSSLGPPGPCSQFSWVITSARCVTLGSTRNGRRLSQLHRRLINPRGTQVCRRSVPPPPPRSVREGHRLETPGGRERPGPACGLPGLSQPSGAEPSPTRWSPVSHLPWRSSPRRPLQRPRPTVGAPSLLELLDLLQAQPRALVDAKVAQHLFHRLCVSVLHGCGGPGRPRLASPRPPRLRLALGPRARATAGARAQTAVPSSFSSSAATAASA